MSKISKIEVMDFRGFNGLQTLEFGDADLVILLGMNGFGKTSVFDSVEWCLTGHLSRYERYLDPGRKQDFTKEKQVLRNKYAANPNTFVKIDLNDGTKFGRRVTATEGECDYGTGSIIDGYEYGLKSISNTNIDQNLSYSYFSATHILSQETIHDFVTSKKPEDRYRALSVNFGTSLYEPFEENVKSLIATLKEKEKALKTNITLKSTRLSDLKVQQQTSIGQIESQISEANEVVSMLNTHSPEFKVQEFKLQDGQIDLKGNTKESVQELIFLRKSKIDELEKKQNTLNFLLLNFPDWQDKNKELRELDKNVIDFKQKAFRIKELQTNAATLQKDLHYFEVLKDKEAVAFNVAKDISELLPQFLEDKLRIEQLNNSILEKHIPIKNSQAQLSELSEHLSHLETQSKEYQELIKEAQLLLTTVHDEKRIDKLEGNQYKSLELEANKLAETSNSEREKILRFTHIENLISSNPQVTEEVNEDLKAALSPQSYELFSESSKLQIKIKNVDSELKTLQVRKQKAEETFKQQTENLSQSKTLLAQAFDLINPEDDTTACPVCEVSHDTSHLISVIKLRLDETESSVLEKLKTDIKDYNQNIEKLLSDKEHMEELFDLARQNVQKALQTEIVALKYQADEQENQLKNVRDKIQFYNEERLKTLSQISSLLAQEVASISSAKPLLEKALNTFIAHETELKAQIAKNLELRSGLTSEIESQFNANKMAQEQIDLLSSHNHKKVSTFLIEKGVNVDKESLAFLQHYTKNLEESLFGITNKIIALSQERNVIDSKLSDERKEITEGEIEKALITLSGRISEITRFLSDYKERCVRVHIDLGELSAAHLESNSAITIASVSNNLKTLELLTKLQNRAIEFELYTKEDSIRKKIVSTQTELDALKVQMEKIKVTKKEIETLKRAFPGTLKDYIHKNLDPELFNKIYHALNPHRRFKSINFDVDVNYHKVVLNFNAKHSNVTARPEFLFSSAQLNTFGVSMFLSMALRQNWLSLNTILLDDPIQNLDDINILSLIDLIRGLLDLKTGKQIVMSTHDERFYNLVKHKFSDYKVKAYKFESYGSVVLD